jgi:hypothetical protein
MLAHVNVKDQNHPWNYMRRVDCFSMITSAELSGILLFTIIQEMLHGREILPLERDRFVDGLIDSIAGQ